MRPARARPEFHRRGFVQILIIAVVALVIGAGAMYGYQKLTTKPSPSPAPTSIGQPISSPAQTPVTDSTIKPVKKVDIAKSQDSYKLNTIKLVNDVLLLSVSYGGGCKEHTFDLVWNGAFNKSLPAQADLFLAHSSNQDTCEAYLTRDLQFDLTLIKQLAIDRYKAMELTLNFYDFENQQHRLNWKY